MLSWSRRIRALCGEKEWEIDPCWVLWKGRMVSFSSFFSFPLLRLPSLPFSETIFFPHPTLPNRHRLCPIIRLLEARIVVKAVVWTFDHSIISYNIILPGWAWLFQSQCFHVFIFTLKLSLSWNALQPLSLHVVYMYNLVLIFKIFLDGITHLECKYLPRVSICWLPRDLYNFQCDAQDG